MSFKVTVLITMMAALLSSVVVVLCQPASARPTDKEAKTGAGEAPVQHPVAAAVKQARMKQELGSQLKSECVFYIRAIHQFVSIPSDRLGQSGRGGSGRGLLPLVHGLDPFGGQFRTLTINNLKLERNGAKSSALQNKVFSLFATRIDIAYRRRRRRT